MIISIPYISKNDDVTNNVKKEKLFAINTKRFKQSDGKSSIDRWILNNNRVWNVQHEEPIPAWIEILKLEV